MATLESDLLESADLERRLLVDSGHTGVADLHVAVALENSQAVDCVTATFLSSGNECVSAR